VDTTTQTLLGIDYGTKRIGVAIAEPGSTLAFPLQVLVNDSQLWTNLDQIILARAVGAVVVGESVNLDGSPNAIAVKVEEFVTKLQGLYPEITINLEPEHYTSFAAERYLGKHEQVDASAAAIILQAWLDRESFNYRDEKTS
jgi:putative holliday junction resolvase